MRHVGETPHQADGVREQTQSARAELSGFEVRLRTQGRTALVELFGELDLATVGQLTDAFNGLALDSNGCSHVVLDLRGLTFMDVAGIHELVRQSDKAHRNRHNLAIVRGHTSINRLMAITAVDALLVLVESPEELIPPATTPVRAVLDATAHAGGAFPGGNGG